MLGKIKFYKDQECTRSADFLFGEILAGDAKALSVFAKNEGPTELVELEIEIFRPDIEVEDKKKFSLMPNQVWSFNLIWKPKIDMNEARLKDEIGVRGRSRPL